MAMDIAQNVISIFMTYLYDPVARELRYAVQYKKNMKRLERQLKILEQTKQQVEISVRDASQLKLEEIDKAVVDWKENVSTIEEDAKKILAERSEDAGWMTKCCSDWQVRYKAGKEAIEMGETIVQALKDGDFKSVSHAPSLPAVVHMHVEVIEGLKSVEMKMNDILSALSTQENTKIGVHGMKGIGKSFLLRRINNELESKPLFKKVIMVPISSYPDILSIQGEIARQLPLNFLDGITVAGRANALFSRLKLEETVLIIFDDMLENLPLSNIGIPIESDHKGLKVILSSTSEKVCVAMETRPTFEIQRLSDDESWILFKAKAGEIVEDPTLKHVVGLLTKECKGLPLAIETFASSLRKEAKYLLSAANASSEDANINSFFALCSLFEKDRNTLSLKLFLYGVAKGFVQADEMLLAAIKICFFLVHRLNVHCLSREGRGEDYVKIQEIVREVAISVAQKVIMEHQEKIGLRV
ncbi:hypothetical protein ACHQM5_010884 [Ranunculus cassubicifolius]